jgi:NADH-quinone oxidoreductase subunit H
MFTVAQILFFLSLFVPLLVVMAFVTLLERKVMGTMQRRRGPNVVGVFGLLQPFADGFKLLLKEPVFPHQADLFIFTAAPAFTFFVSLLSWVVMPLTHGTAVLDLNVAVLFVLGSSSLGVYGILLAGWASNSKYAFFGAIRSAAQMVSYEVSMTLAVFPVLCLSQSLSLYDIVFAQVGFGKWGTWFVSALVPSALCFFVAILAETNRSPFDLPEAEGELVAGYNVEYAAFFFAFFYLAEYLNILLLSALFVVLFLGGGGHPLIVRALEVPFAFWFSLKTSLLVYAVIWVRATLPRYRYDQLMLIGWKVLLPFTTGYAVLIAGVLFVVLRLFESCTLWYYWW